MLPAQLLSPPPPPLPSPSPTPRALLTPLLLPLPPAAKEPCLTSPDGPRNCWLDRAWNCSAAASGAEDERMLCRLPTPLTAAAAAALLLRAAAPANRLAPLERTGLSAGAAAEGNGFFATAFVTAHASRADDDDELHPAGPRAGCTPAAPARVGGAPAEVRVGGTPVTRPHPDGCSSAMTLMCTCTGTASGTALRAAPPAPAAAAAAEAGPVTSSAAAVASGAAGNGNDDAARCSSPLSQPIVAVLPLEVCFTTPGSTST